MRPTTTAAAAVFVAGETLLLYVDVVHTSVQASSGGEKEAPSVGQIFSDADFFVFKLIMPNFNQKTLTCCWKNRKRKNMYQVCVYLSSCSFHPSTSSTTSQCLSIPEFPRGTIRIQVITSVVTQQ